MRYTIIPVCSWHMHSKHVQNTQKCMKSKNYLSLLQFSLLLLNCQGSHFALIYKFKSLNSNDTRTPMKYPPRPNMSGRGRVLRDNCACPLVQYTTHPNMHRKCLCIHPSLVAWSDGVTHPCRTSVVLWLAISPPRRETLGSIPIGTN